jgi:Cu(I)/Ag(I) efflux system membrane fusion protein
MRIARTKSSIAWPVRAARAALWIAAALAAAGCGGGGEVRDRHAAARAEGPAPSRVEQRGHEGHGAMVAAGEERPTPLRVSARQAALAGMTFALAREAPLEKTVRAVAMAVPNERGLTAVHARVAGWVERLHANETGRFVPRGAPLLDLYAPELVTAQEELVLARSLAGTPVGDSLLAAARRRLRLWAISDDQIAEIERSGRVRRTLTLRAPASGHVIEKSVVEGQRVEPGDRLYTLADLSTIWIEPAIFESDIPWVRSGQKARVSFEALPGRTFEGTVTFVYPQLDVRTRTLKVRVEVPNPGLLVKPGMYGTVRMEAEGPHGVVVPLNAVLPTGTADLAFVVREGAVWPTEVAVAGWGDSTVLVAQGLEPGDTVVASATFLLDSESQLAAALAGIMLDMGMGLDMGGMPMPGMQEMEMPGMEMPPPPAPPRRDSAPGARRRPGP